MMCSVALLMAILAAAVEGSTMSAATAADGGGSLDVQIAVDSTGSMLPLIEQAREDAKAIVDEVLKLDPGARFSVVEFRDPGYPAPEYRVLQKFTTDTAAVTAALGRLQATSTDDPRNVPSEAYNLVFERSVTDTAIGWRASSQKLVVVLGDAEPHGAGTLGIRGCRDTAPDPDGLDTINVLAKMRATGRALLMVRQNGKDATLECYTSIASQAAPGSAARNAGSTDLVQPIRALLSGTVVTVQGSVGFPFALPRTTRTLSFRIGNAGGRSETLAAVTLRLPAGTSFVSSQGGFGAPVVQASRVSWPPSKPLAPGAYAPLLVKVRVGSGGGGAFRTTVQATFADGGTATSTVTPLLRVGRSLGLRVSSSGTGNPVKGSAALTYGRAATSLLGKTTARGSISFGASSSRVVVRLDRARVTGASRTMSATVGGTVTSSARPSCKRGTTVTLRLVDRDVLKPESTPDLVTVVGGGCGTRAGGDIVTR